MITRGYAVLVLLTTIVFRSGNTSVVGRKRRRATNTEGSTTATVVVDTKVSKRGRKARDITILCGN
jgi:hypothetical protein